MNLFQLKLISIHNCILHTLNISHFNLYLRLLANIYTENTFPFYAYNFPYIQQRSRRRTEQLDFLTCNVNRFHVIMF